MLEVWELMNWNEFNRYTSRKAARIANMTKQSARCDLTCGLPESFDQQIIRITCSTITGQKSSAINAQPPEIIWGLPHHTLRIPVDPEIFNGRPNHQSSMASPWIQIRFSELSCWSKSWHLKNSWFKTKMFCETTWSGFFIINLIFLDLVSTGFPMAFPWFSHVFPSKKPSDVPQRGAR